MKLFAITIAIIAIHFQTFAQENLPPVRALSTVNLQQYLGPWYEIAAIPQIFESQCVGNSTASYKMAENNLIAVLNSCDTADGSRKSAEGRAMVMDPASPAKLKVSFVNFFGWQFALAGDYWILATDEAYSYAVVGAPGRDFAWVLSRSPGMTRAQIAETYQALVLQSFDPCKLITTRQNLGLQENIPFCQLMQGQ